MWSCMYILRLLLTLSFDRLFLPSLRSRVRGDLIESTFLSSVLLGVYKFFHFFLPSPYSYIQNLRQKLLYVSITPTVHINRNDVHLF